MSPKPLIGITACRREIEPHEFHVVGDKYVTAVVEGAGGFPVPIPALGDALGVDEILHRIDGLLLTGSPSNVEPHHYGGSPSKAGTAHDAARDATTLPLIPAVLEAGVPLLALCRGFQEVNVALGGTLHQAVHDVPGYQDHREDSEQSLEVQYGPAHAVHYKAGGLLRALTGEDQAIVNSLHSQGVDRLAEGVAVEATAEDGLVEAFRVEKVTTFALAVQWHPEWQVRESPHSMAIFRAFGKASRERAGRRRWIP